MASSEGAPRASLCASSMCDELDNLQQSVTRVNRGDETILRILRTMHTEETIKTFEARDVKGGWIIAQSPSMVPMIVRAIVSNVNCEDTPDASHVAREQLRHEPDEEHLNKLRALIDAVLEYSSDAWHILCINILLHSLHAFVGNISGMTVDDKNSICKAVLLQRFATDGRASVWGQYIHDARCDKFVSLSTQVTRRLESTWNWKVSSVGYLLDKTPFGTLPDDIKRRIHIEACWNNVHLLHRFLDAQKTPKAALFRAHMHDCVALTLILGCAERCGHPIDIVHLRSQLVTRARHTRKLSRITPSVRERLMTSSPVLNTLVVCSMKDFVMLRRVIDGKTVGRVTHAYHTAFQCDIVCMEASKLHLASKFQFARCIIFESEVRKCSVPIRAHRRWVLKSSFRFKVSEYQMDSYEAKILQIKNPPLSNLDKHAMICIA